MKAEEIIAQLEQAKIKMKEKEMQDFTQGFACFCVKNIKYKDQFGHTLTSSKGDTMLRFDMVVTDSEGFTDSIYEYATKATHWKNKQLEKALGCPGVLTEYLNGLSDVGVVEELISQSGMCAIKLDKSKDERYEDKFMIANYLEKEAVTALKIKAQHATAQQGRGIHPKISPRSQAPTKVEHDFDDGIPF